MMFVLMDEDENYVVNMIGIIIVTLMKKSGILYTSGFYLVN